MPAKKPELDLDAVMNMAAKFCTLDEIALKLDFDKDAFAKLKGVREAFERGKNLARISIRSLLYDAALSSDKQAIIFLAKNELGYRDYPPEPSAVSSVPRIIDDVEAPDG